MAAVMAVKHNVQNGMNIIIVKYCHNYLIAMIYVASSELYTLEPISGLCIADCCTFEVATCTYE